MGLNFASLKAPLVHSHIWEPSNVASLSCIGWICSCPQAWCRFAMATILGWMDALIILGRSRGMEENLRWSCPRHLSIWASVQFCRRLLDGLGKVSDGIGWAWEGVGWPQDVLDGLRKVLDCLRKVLDGLGKVSWGSLTPKGQKN